MNVSHHLTDETLQDHAAGSLTASMETLIACHLTVCAACRRRIALAEDVGGALLNATAPESVRQSAADVLALARRLEGHEAANTTAVCRPAPAAGVPRPLGRLLPAPLDKLDWRRVAPGIKQFNLSNEHRRHGAFKLLHLAPGVVLSAHSHDSRELTYVVRGSYQDAIGRFKAGDIADLDGSHLHRPVVDTEQPCIALIASQSPARFTGMFARLMQPFVGI